MNTLSPAKMILTGIIIVAVNLLGPQPSIAQAADEAAASQSDTQIQLTFPDSVELKTVIDYVAIRLGKNIIYDDAQVKRPITLRSPVPVDKDELLAILRSALRFRGLSLVEGEQPGWLKIVPDDSINQSMAQWLVAPPASEDADSIVTRIIQLKHISVSQFTELINPLLSKPGGNVLQLPTGKTFVITDYKSVVDALLYLQEMVDKPSLAFQWKIRPLKNTVTKSVVNELDSLIRQTSDLSKAGKKPGESAGATPAIPIAQLNAFLLTGTSDQIEHVESLIQVLDVSVDVETRIYPLKLTSADRAASILKQLTLPQQSMSPVDQWIITPDMQGNTLIVTCPKFVHTQIAQWVKDQIDIASEATTTGASTRVFQIKYTRATELASTLQEVFSVGDDGESIQVDLEPATPSSTQPAIPTSIGRNTSRERQPMARKAGGAKNASSLFSLTVHEPTNSIILTAPRPMLVQAERLIERLDHHRPQVLIDVTIVSVSESRSLDLGIDIQHLHTDPSGNVDRGVLSSFGLLNVDPVSGSTTAQFGGGLNAVLLRPEEVSIMLRAFRSKLNGQVVAQPRLLVDDNASGSLNSISEQPYTSINSGQTVSTTSFAGYAEAGTQLTLTPHISEGGVVHLDYEIRSSSFTGSSPSGNTPPPRATDSIRSQVTIPSGYVLLVGGLTREDQTNAHSEVPLLADIPILGELFRIRTESRRRTVLYVFLTPRILKEDRFAYLKHISRQSLKQTPVEPDMPDLKMEFLP